MRYGLAPQPLATGKEFCLVPRRMNQPQWYRMQPARPAKRTPQLIWRICVTLSSIVLAASCQGEAQRTPTQPERVVLQLKWKHQFQFAGYYAAQQQGFYRAAGLDVQILESPAEGDPANVVLQGKADFGIASSDLVLLRSQGKPVVALAAIFQHSPLIMLALKRSGIDNVHDLAKKRVMIEPHAAELLAYLKYESINAADLTILPHTFDPSALMAGQVDAISAYSTDEPFVLEQAGLDYLIFNPRAGGIDFYGDTLFTTEEQIRLHPERVQAFLTATLQGWQYALDHQTAMVDLIGTTYSQRHSREHLLFEAEKTRQLILPDVVEIGYMNPGRWQHIAETYAELGMAPPNLSLRGFLYDRNPQPDMTWLYLTLLGAAVLVGVTSTITARFYQLNTAIRREMTERERVAASLEALEQRYQVMVEHAPFPILIVHLGDGLLIYINPSAAQTFAIAQTYAIGKSAQDYYVHPEDRGSFLALLDQQGYVQNFEVLLRTARGEEFWASLSAALIDLGAERAIFVALTDVTERRDLERRLEMQAMTDDLTGLFNRRYFTHKGSEEIQRARRYTLPLAMMMVDVDRFKQINDTYGHDRGDYVLREFATLIRQSVRDVDVVSRLGGEEFGLMLPNTDLASTLAMAERLRQEIEAHHFLIEDRLVRITASIGVAALGDDEADLNVLLSHADTAMYQAKHQGRNRVALYESAGQ